MHDWTTVVALFLGLKVKHPVIRLKNGSSFRVRSAMDIWIVKETCIDRDYERTSVSLEDGWIIFDIGAGIGDFAISAALEYPNSIIYAFEPFPESFALLLENIEQNRVTNVYAFPQAIGYNSGTMHLVMETNNCSEHSTSKSSKNIYSSICVPGISLFDVFKENNILQCDFMKVDCEGGEYDIFLNTDKQTLKKIHHICMEFHNGFTKYSHVDLINFFEKNGFRVKIRPDPAHSHLGFLYASQKF